MVIVWLIYLLIVVDFSYLLEEVRNFILGEGDGMIGWLLFLVEFIIYCVDYLDVC